MSTDDRLLAHLHRQARASEQLGSPLYAMLLGHLADDLVAGGPSCAVLGGYAGDPDPDAVALRLLGGVHRLVLAGEAPELADYFPSVGGRADAAGAGEALRGVLERHRADLQDALGIAPQTNEVGRAAALIGGLLHVAALTPLPVRLVEIGASAGLNLRADHFRVELGNGQCVGPADSPVVLRDAWRGNSPPASTLRIVQRLGCDIAPLDPTDDADTLTLQAYVWGDMTERLDRLRGALAVARVVPATVERAGAADFLGRLRLQKGTVTVLWHSVMWQYLPSEERAAVGECIRGLAEQARPDLPFARLAMEPDREDLSQRHDFRLTLSIWPLQPGPVVLARPAAHGIPTVWS